MSKPRPAEWPSKIRPVDFKGAVALRLKQAGLKICGSHAVTLNTEVVTGLYPNIPTAILNRTLAHMAGQDAVVILATGENAINEVAKIVGKQSNPQDCAFESLRYLWSQRDNSQGYGFSNHIRLDGHCYWYNDVRCSRTQEEFEKNRILLLENPTVVKF